MNIIVGYYICTNAGAFGPVKVDQTTEIYEIIHIRYSTMFIAVIHIGYKVIVE